jgi:hypothetical protein
MATMHATGLFRHSRRDAVLVAASVMQAVLLLLWPSVLTIGIGLWWCANTVSHNFIHLPFFRSRPANAGFSIYLSLLMGFPQSLWRQRHLAHHADAQWRFRPGTLLLVETLCVVSLWCLVAATSPQFFLTTYLPGWLLGLALCQLQGHYEHAHGTTSHYGWVYNFFFFNDGYHVEHHRRPARHWSELAVEPREHAAASPWPAVLRWLDSCTLEGLERLVLRSRLLQFLVVHIHARAFRKLLRKVPAVRNIGIVGGALFPRTALLLQRLAPDARIVIIDCNPQHIQTAHTFLNGSVQYEQRLFDGASRTDQFDLVIIPLSFRGNRDMIYEQPPAPAVLVHDWLWRRRGHHSLRISWLLLKRLNLVLR